MIVTPGDLKLQSKLKLNFVSLTMKSDLSNNINMVTWHVDQMGDWFMCRLCKNYMFANIKIKLLHMNFCGARNITEYIEKKCKAANEKKGKVCLCY